MKRIVILCDGTWNSPDKITGGKPCQTNIVKIAQAVKEVADDNVQQLTYYDPGIGTSGVKLKKLFNGATGAGISKNILEAYKYLIIHYEIGDELFLFGFSRGAFTVRSLAGLIRNSGILRPDAILMVDKAYKLYKSRSPLSHPRANEATLFRKTYAVRDKVPIKFIGVWDTVGSLGNPLFINNVFSKLSFSVLGNRFHDTDLSSTVNNAFQALAIDETRRNFKATLWQQQATSIHQILEQVWFIGVHSNIGGGYPSTGLSDVALEWMISKADSCGLSLEPIPIKSNPMEVPERSWKGFYKLTPRYYRPIGKSENGNESLHNSVIERLKIDNKYRPKNLGDYFP
jgi:uncharacterized protein (DUF2235 family)